MEHRRLLIWGTGMENDWRVRVSRVMGEFTGFREVTGPIVASRGRLLLTSYDGLTMAAQLKDITLPLAHEQDLMIEVPSGEYHCRVIQMIGPDDYELQPDPIADFALDLVRSDEPIAPWAGVPWADASG
jgi:hypothetical protein